MQKLKLGTVHIALPSSIITPISDEFAVFDMTFLVADHAHVDGIEREIFWPQVAQTVEGGQAMIDKAVWLAGGS